MPRHNKIKVLLKTVEERLKPSLVIRLGPAKEPEDTRPPVRLGPVKKISEVLPTEGGDPKVARTHQPDIDDLIDKPVAANEDTELTWGEESRMRRTRPLGWFFLACLVLTGAVVWSLLSVKKSVEVAEIRRTQADESIIDEASEQREAENLINGLESTIRSYFSATSIESRLRWVRFPERVEPMMRQHEKISPVTPSPLRTIRLLQPLSIPHHTQFWMASVALANGERRELVLEVMDAGPRIDWETMVCYQPMPWDEFAGRGTLSTSMDFRLYAEPATFFSHEFSNEEEWACYRLSTANAEEVMFGYVRRGTEQEAEMAKLTSGIHRASLILRLQIPPGLKSHMGVVIEKIISPRWLHITLPVEEN